MRLTSRVHSLEERTGGKPGACKCQGGARVLYVTDWRPVTPEPGPLICQDCHRERVTITVKYVDNWRPGEATP